MSGACLLLLAIAVLALTLGWFKPSYEYSSRRFPRGSEAAEKEWHEAIKYQMQEAGKARSELLSGVISQADLSPSMRDLVVEPSPDTENSRTNASNPGRIRSLAEIEDRIVESMPAQGLHRYKR
ncbi:MAG: hypothetical protein R3F17_04730 [Planctomycetota bacterium]